MAGLGSWEHVSSGCAPLIEGIALGSLGLVYLRLGDYAGARGYFEQSLRILREIGDRQGEGLVLAHLGLLSHKGYTQ